MGPRAFANVTVAALCLTTVSILCAGADAAAAPAGQGWGAWQRMAVAALDGAGDGPVTAIGPSSGVTTSSVTTASGQSVPVAERSFGATVGQDPVVVAESLFQGSQMVVTEADVVTGVEDVLVLSPGSANVQSAHKVRGRTMRVSVASGAGPGTTADTPGSCNVGVWPPDVVGSGFGPLIGAETGVWCADPETIGIISGLYEYLYTGSKAVSSAGGSQYAYDLYITAWAACTPSSGSTYFQTAGLWTINGALQPGYTSAWTPLACAPI